MTADALRQHFNNWSVPAHLHDGLARYLCNGIETGGYLRAVLENDLRGAVSRSSSRSTDEIKAITGFLGDAAPQSSWGSSANVNAWIAGRWKEHL